MSAAIIEINDSGVYLSLDSSHAITSPACAVVVDDHVYIGDEGLRRCRLHPLSSYNEFWHSLSEQPLRKQTRHYRHHADLAFAHLQLLWEKSGKPEEILFAVPGDLSNSQLSLLLGLAQASRFRAVGLVDSAVAAVAAVAGAGSYACLDMHLHRTVVTFLTVGDKVKRESVLTLENVGLQRVYDACAKTVTDAFIREQRFDPQSEALTEQALYDHLPVWLAAFRSNDNVMLEMEYRGLDYRTQLSRSMITDALSPLLIQMKSAIAQTDSLLLRDAVASLPGAIDFFGCENVVTPADIARSCQRHEGLIRGGDSGLALITTLPATSEPRFLNSPPDSASAVSRAACPTHVLSGSLAIAVGTRPLYLHRSGAIDRHPLEDAEVRISTAGGRVVINALNGASAFINGAPFVDGRSLQTSDRITLKKCATDFRLITEVSTLDAG